ncbi:LOW QUALITY PROTEIN: hypothetical protein QYF61_002983 [Mycteria americana]|uniref:Uncharacterized protein n=1 Tax=Mycteria americana TaxID=33587 RepID=A0AAN7NW91_MYCAM|nr:LOW QUALITY PROTEIN: hypothetical protein QYF61_002983 [Mycteria americana]
MMIMASWVQPDLDCSPLLLELLKAVVLGVLVAALTAAQKYKCTVKWAERAASELSQDLGKSLQAELEAEQKKRVRSEIAATRLQNQLRDAFVRERELWSVLAEARREDLESECGHCGLSKERELADGGVAGRYPWEEMERAKCQHDERTAPQLCPLIKTEFQYEGGADTAPEIITKEIPYSATELAKLQDRYSSLEKRRQNVCGGSPSRGRTEFKLSEEEAQGYWGPGVFLTVPDTRAPWSLTQRAGGLDPLERGDPVTIPTPGLDQSTESVQKAACLQLGHDRHLTPHQPSPMLLKADPSRMKPLIKGLPDPLKLHAIQIQDRLRAALPIQERLTEMLTPRRSQRQSTPAEFPLTWGGVAQELISYSRNVGISGGEQRGGEPDRRLLKHSDLVGGASDLDEYCQCCINSPYMYLRFFMWANVSCHHFAVVALSSATKGQDGWKGSVVVCKYTVRLRCVPAFFLSFLDRASETCSSSARAAAVVVDP